MKPSIPRMLVACVFLHAQTLVAQEPAPAVLASEQQTAKLREEFLTWKFGLFIHFNLATFNGREWANGYEDPLTFAPDQLDCGQWADAAKAAGMKYAVLTVKHTEGYCLWDSAHTTHDIAAFKNFKGGKGDIVREFVDAFRKRGIKVGFYYCGPGDWDNHNGNTLPAGKPSLQGMPPEAADDFQGFVKKQFSELLTNYGPVDLVWFDASAVKFNPRQWRDIKAHMQKLQPNCLVIANRIHDFNDSDIFGYEYPVFKDERGYPPAGNTMPSEVCDTITTNDTWFWQPDSEKNLRSAEDVVAALRKYNDCRANYLLDVGPDRSGRMPEAFVKRMKEIGDLWRRQEIPADAR